MPVTGEVLEVNPALDGNPELVNTDPYGEGWMIKAKVANVDDVAALLSVELYRALIGH
jgi:glycine cleavage system H protein